MLISHQTSDGKKLLAASPEQLERMLHAERVFKMAYYSFEELKEPIFQLFLNAHFIVPLLLLSCYIIIPRATCPFKPTGTGAQETFGSGDTYL